MKLLGRILDTLRGQLKRPIRYAGAEWNRISMRERRLILLLAVTFLVCLLLLAAYFLFDSVRTMSEENQDMRDALDAIAKHSDDYREGKAKAKAQEERIGNAPPQLATDLEAAAKEAGIQIPETIDRPTNPAGKRYLEHTLDVKLRKVELKALGTFLQKVETGPRMILITRLQIRRSFGSEGNTVDVDLTATTFERTKEGMKKAGKAKAP